MADEQVQLADLVTAFRLEMKDGLAQVAELGSKLTAFQGQVSEGFKKVRTDTESAAKGLSESWSTRLSTMGASSAKFIMGLVGIGGIAWAITSLARAFISANKEQDEFRMKLTGIVGSTKAAAAELDKLEDAAIQLGMQTKEVVNAYVTLSQRGIKPTIEMMGLLRAAGKSVGMDMQGAAAMLMYATMGWGRGLKTFGIEMVAAGSKVEWQWINAAGKVTKVISLNTAKAIEQTLLSIWNEKYKAAMEQQSYSWEAMWTSIKGAFERAALQEGPAALWTELKVQVAEFRAVLLALTKDGSLQTWGSGVATVMDPVITIIGTVARGWLMLPVAIALFRDRAGSLLNDFGAFMNTTVLPPLTRFAIKVQTAFDAATGGTSQAVDAMKVGLAGMADQAKGFTGEAERLRVAAMKDEAVLDAMAKAAKDAGAVIRNAAADLRDGGAAGGDLGTGMNLATKGLTEYQQQVLATRGAMNAAMLDQKMNDVMTQATAMYQANVPLEQIMRLLGPDVIKFSQALGEMEPGMVKGEEVWRRFTEGIASGKFGFEDALKWVQQNLSVGLQTEMDKTGIVVQEQAIKWQKGIKGGIVSGFEQGFADSTEVVNRYAKTLGEMSIHVPARLTVDKEWFARELKAAGLIPNTTGQVP